MRYLIAWSVGIIVAFVIFDAAMIGSYGVDGIVRNLRESDANHFGTWFIVFVNALAFGVVATLSVIGIAGVSESMLDVFGSRRSGQTRGCCERR